MTTPDQEAMIERLWLATKHGDNEHQEWLHEAYAAFFAGKPVPEPRGRGNKEARIAELEAQVEALTASQPDVSDYEVWRRFERAIDAEAKRLCRQGCRDEPCHCLADLDKDWRRDAINSLRRNAQPSGREAKEG